ncbi:MAG: hypothetical protein V3U65_04190, partial [Granulosicoccaceae bacterium]
TVALKPGLCNLLFLLIVTNSRVMEKGTQVIPELSNDWGPLLLNAIMNCLVDIRYRTFSCATITAPDLPKFSLPPVWSKCQCVSMI